MAQSRIDGDFHVNGVLTAKTLDVPASTIVDADVSSAADIGQSKLEHQFEANYGQSGTAASATIPIGIIYGASGTMLDIRAASIAACVGAATVTVDLKKNGTSMLSAVITLDNANTARVAEAGTLTTTTLANGDFLELVIVATAGGGTLATGLCVNVRWKAKAA